MTATLTTTVQDVPTTVGKLNFKGHATNGHAANASASSSSSTKKSEAKLVDPFNYVVSVVVMPSRQSSRAHAQGETFGEIDESYPYADLLRKRFFPFPVTMVAPT